MDLRKVVVGLGNPGMRYRATPHNFGFEVVDLLAAEAGEHWVTVGCSAMTLVRRLGDLELVLAKPQTYMNLSGQAVSQLLEQYLVSASDLVVVCDDLALPFGKIRIRAQGSAGGHRGLGSIIKELGHTQFTRVRLGIGLETGVQDAAEYVLSSIDGSLAEIATQMVVRGRDAVKAVCLTGVKSAMNLFN
jgi:peptidyl-tRNA hydrolase, PTH1 family